MKNKTVTLYYVVTNMQVMFKRQVVFSAYQDRLIEMANYVGYSAKHIGIFQYNTEQWHKDCDNSQYPSLNYYESVKLAEHLEKKGFAEVMGKPLSDYLEGYLQSKKKGD